MEQPEGIRRQPTPDGFRLSFWGHGFPRDLRLVAVLVATAAVYFAWFGFQERNAYAVLMRHDWLDPRLGDVLFAVLPPLAVGLWLVQLLSQRRYVEVDAASVRAWVSLGTRLELWRRDLEQFYVADPGTVQPGEPRWASAELRAIRRGGSGSSPHLTLVKGPPAWLRYIEQQLEEKMRLEDAPVAGEWRATPHVVVGVRACPNCGQDLADHEITRQLAPAAAPAGLEVSERGERREMTWRWFQPLFLFMVLWLMVWDSVCIGMVLSLGPFAFLIPHVWLGVGITYWVICGFLNRTRVEASPQGLRVYCTPLPWWTPTLRGRWPRLDHTLRREDIRQFYVVSVPGKQTTFKLEVLLADGARRTLLSGLSSSAIPLYLEQELERFYKIANEPVSGELGPV